MILPLHWSFIESVDRLGGGGGVLVLRGVVDCGGDVRTAVSIFRSAYLAVGLLCLSHAGRGQKNDRVHRHWMSGSVSLVAGRIVHHPSASAAPMLLCPQTRSGRLVV
jgi:hypothetical protein